MSDGDLRKIFREHLPNAMWTSIESGSTAAGIPDSHFLFEYDTPGWIEFKLTSTNAVKIGTFQIAFAEKYWRMGGRCFLAVRKKKTGCDELHLFAGKRVRSVSKGGLRGAIPLGRFSGGPKKWDWWRIEEILTG